MSVTEKMQAILGESSDESSVEIEVKAILPQLLLVMRALGLDPTDEAAQEAFVGVLKKLVTNKTALLKAMRANKDVAAKKAFKAAKSAM